LGGGAVGVGTICLLTIGAAVVDICSYRTARAHFDNPSTSSTSFSRFLWRSTVFASSWSDGDRSAPFMLSWCRSPKPAWSYFSTAAIFSIIPAVVLGDLAFEVICVDGSFSYSTMISTSSNRSKKLSTLTVSFFTCSVSWVGIWVGLVRVDRWLIVSFAFALFSSYVSTVPFVAMVLSFFSRTIILSTNSATSSSRCTIWF
jgi:hypothetical protein